MTSKNIVDLINRLASVKADASSVYTTAEVNSLTNANRELIEANTQTDITNYNSLDSRLSILINELKSYLPLAGGNITGNLTVQNKNVVRTVNNIEADVNGNVKQYQVPDYSAGVRVSNNSFIPATGILHIILILSTPSSHCRCFLDGVRVAGTQVKSSNTVVDTAANEYEVIAKKGCKFTYISELADNQFSVTATLYPFKTVTE